MNPSVFLTGPRGFLGGTILEHLRARGVAVGALTRDRSLRGLGEPDGALAHVTLAHGDLLDPDSYRHALEGRDVVIHAAPIAPSWGSYALHRERAAHLTRGLIEACAQARVKRLVMISAVEVYGGGLSGLITEERPTVVRGELCGDTHAEAEDLALEAHRAGRLPVVILRAALCYGDRDTQFFPRLATDLVQGRSAIVGDGGGRPLLCDARALAECAWLAATAPESATGHAYNVADADCRLTWGELLTQIHADLRAPYALRRVPEWVAGLASTVSEGAAHLVGTAQPPALTRHIFEVLTARHRLSVQKASEALGWTPRPDTATTLLEYVKYWAPIYNVNRGAA